MTDAEVIRRMGLPEKKGRRLLRQLDDFNGRKSGFPQKIETFDNRRYWPASFQSSISIGAPGLISMLPPRQRRQVNGR